MKSIFFLHCTKEAGPKIDSLTAYKEFTGTKYDYGKGVAQTPQVQWLEYSYYWKNK
jgi:hypothetical protein